METHHPIPKDKEDKNPSPSSSPNATSSSSSSSNGSLPLPTPPSLTPKSNPNSNPYPTTFIQADTSSFKQVVQMLTGSAETAAKRSSTNNPTPPPKTPIPPLSKATAPKKPAFKLYERRNSMKNLKMISPLIPSFIASNPNSPAPRNKPEILSPSILDFPSLALSPVTPLIPDPFNRSPNPNWTAAASSAEERAIAEKGFYLHPSPRTMPRDSEPPRLLPLFPVTSPRIANSSAAASP